MKENFLIHIEGTIVTDEVKDVVDLTTVGSFYQRDCKSYICYNESDATGFDGSMTTVKVWDRGASITRYGKHRSCLIIEEGATNICNYDTPAGSIMLDINGVQVKSQLCETGGSLNLAYSLNGSGMLISDNTININVKEM
ncbi:MAG: DUF1934 domain-containing protein [Oscillospiraceae bacterium]